MEAEIPPVRQPRQVDEVEAYLRHRAAHGDPDALNALGIYQRRNDLLANLRGRIAQLGLELADLIPCP